MNAGGIMTHSLHRVMFSDSAEGPERVRGGGVCGVAIPRTLPDRLTHLYTV